MTIDLKPYHDAVSYTHLIRQNLAVRKYIDSQTGTQTEEEIKQEAYESGAKQTDLDAFEQVVEDVCEEIGDYLKTLQKSDTSVYYFASSDKERVTKSIDKEEICAIGNHTIVTREQVQMYTKFYEITYDKTLSEKKAIAYAKERNALYVAACLLYTSHRSCPGHREYVVFWR